MRTIRLNGLTLTLDEREDALTAKAARALGIAQADMDSLSVLQRALDARRNRPPQYVVAVKLVLRDSVTIPESLSDGLQIQPFHELPEVASLPHATDVKRTAVVIGSGPAGLFAAYALSLSKVSVLLLERGKPVEERVKDVETFWRTGILNEHSNVLFGEGGAGTFSDGKLTSRTKNPYAAWVKKVLVDMGAPDAILTEAKPHIGTDKLREVTLRMRKALTAQGCEIRFGARVTDFIVQQNKLAAVVVNATEEIPCDQAVLAIGQGADDTYRVLGERGVRMEPKPFAMGLRVEHPQELINSIQYGRWSRHPALPPAEYFVTAAVEAEGRSVYTFCMCPGGQVIGCSAFPGTVITNGMSHHKRNGRFADSAVVVNVRTEDFAPDGDSLSGLAFRRLWEQKAFAAAGGNYFAPAQKLAEFVEKKFSGAVGPTSFRPGVQATALSDVLPEFVVNALRTGLKKINQKMPGFIAPEAHLIGIETRTSSPVRICRREDGQSETVRGLYPCGEGAGYAGGIISSALDGIKAARNLMAQTSGNP